MEDDDLPSSRRPYVPPPARDGERVPDSEFLTSREAAAVLGTRVTHARLLMLNHLHGAQNRRGDPGVTRESVEREREFRRSASRWQRLKRVLKNPADAVI